MVAVLCLSGLFNIILKTPCQHLLLRLCLLFFNPAKRSSISFSNRILFGIPGILWSFAKFTARHKDLLLLFTIKMLVIQIPCVPFLIGNFLLKSLKVSIRNCFHKIFESFDLVNFVFE